MEDTLGCRTVYQNLRAAAAGSGVPVARVDIWAREGLASRVLPASIASSLKARAEVMSLVSTVRPDYLITDTQKPVLLCHDLVSRLPTGIMTDVTPVQFDALNYFSDSTDRVPGARWAKRAVAASLFRRAAVLLPWSNWAARSLIDDYGVDPERVVVVHPGVDTDLWSPAPRDNVRTPRLVFVGGDFERKGGSDLLDWYRRSGRRSCSLTIVTRSAVAEEEGVTVVRADNNSDSLRQLLRSADLFVLPTRADSFNLAAVEAMSSGLPVVIGNVGGISDIVEDGVNGRLITPGDADMLGAVLDSLVASPALLREMSVASRQRALAKFDVKAMFRELVSIGSAIAVGADPGEFSWAAARLDAL